MMELKKMGGIRFGAQILRRAIPAMGALAPAVLSGLFAFSTAWAGDNAPASVAVSNVAVERIRTTVRVDRNSGRLIRTQVISPREVPSLEVLSQTPAARSQARPTPLADRSAVDQIVEEAAIRHDVDPLLAKSVLAVESAYNQFATSPKGAMGYMQLMPGTARQLGVTNAYDARQNIEGGVKFLRYLKSKFNDERLVLAAYNAGEAAVKKHGWIPPYPETIDYVYKVGKRYGEARREARSSAPALSNAKSDAVSAPKPEPRIAQVVDAEGRIHLRIP